MSSNRYDIIVIGGGHNGLTAAAYLAKAGRRVIVLERRDVLGGLAAGEEFHPGYRTTGLLHDTTALRSRVVNDLSLEKHGLELAPAPPPVLSPAEEGTGLLLHHDPGTAAEEIANHSARDAERYREYRRFLKRVGEAVSGVLDDAPPDPTDGGVGERFRTATMGLALRRLGSKDMMEIMRIGPMCVADYLNEWFETDALKCLLAARAISGTWSGPWSPGTNANLIRSETTATRHVVGGPAALVEALRRAATSRGVEIRTGARVTEIRAAGRVSGVTIEGGETIDAGLVAASCDPRHGLLTLLQPGAISPKLAQRLEGYRMRGTTAKVNLALSQPLELSGREGITFAHTGSTLDEMEQAFDAIKYRRMSERPLLDIHVPSITNAKLAPEGHAVVSMLVHFAPHALEGGWTDGARQTLGERAVEMLKRYAPKTENTIVAREVLSPLDISERYGVTGGHVHHGEHALDQLLVRPTPECARYATPIGGLFLCGSGSHPGGGVSCAPGMIAASYMLKS